MKTSQFTTESEQFFKEFRKDLTEAINAVAAKHGVKLANHASLGNARFTETEFWYVKKLNFNPAITKVRTEAAIPTSSNERMKLLQAMVGHEYKTGSRNMTVLNIITTGQHTGKANIQTRRGKKYIATLEQLMSFHKNF